MKVILFFGLIVLCFVSCQNFATYYSMEGLGRDRSVNSILKKVSLPHPVLGMRKYTFFTSTNINNVLIADIFVSKSSLVGSFNQSRQNDLHFRGANLTCKIVFSWNKKFNFFPFVPYRKGTGILLLKSKLFDLDTKYNKTKEGRLLEVHSLHIEFDNVQKEFFSAHTYTNKNTDDIQ